MLIVIRDKNTQHIELSHKAKDKISMKVDIPTITISFQDGQKLLRVLVNKENVLMKFQMPIP